MRKAHDPAALEAMWRPVPEAERQSPEIALEAARLFNDAGAGLGRLAIESIESSLHDPPSKWDESSARALLEEYGACARAAPRDQLERVEAWLQQAIRGCHSGCVCCTRQV